MFSQRHLLAFALAALTTGAAALPVYTITDIGLVDAEHTRSTDGSKASFVRQLNDAGQVAGDANRYNAAGGFIGTTAWLFNGTTTTNIGLVDAEHTRSTDGFKRSFRIQLNDAGQVTGDANRYNAAGDSIGDTAWLFNGTTTTNIGLVDAEHTRSTDGSKTSSQSQLNDAGQVTGDANRYNAAGDSIGTTAWLFDGTTTANIGLVDAEHTRSTDGSKTSSQSQLNDAGQVTGRASRYNAAGGSIGNTAWLFDGTTTANIGLVDAEHTRSTDGSKRSFRIQLNDAGQVAGLADRYNAASDSIGTTAWLFDGTTTANIGLVDAEHTRSTDGSKASFVSHFNDAGQVTGGASRYNATGDPIGTTTWLFNGTTTANIGLVDAEHTRSTDGFKTSFVSHFNDAGQVAGGASRFNGAGGPIGNTGTTAWLFDGITTIAFDLDHGHSGGEGNSSFSWLGDDGSGLGQYTFYDVLTDAFLGRRAFGFTPLDGFFDLGDTVAGGLGANGWDFLSSSLGPTDSAFLPTGDASFVAGQGVRSGQLGNAAFLLSAQTGASVPAPAPALLLAVGLVGLAIARRRRAATAVVR
jgi:hypothetical protein